MTRPTATHKRDFDAYVRWANEWGDCSFDPLGDDSVLWLNPGTHTALEAFVEYESSGVPLGVVETEVELLRLALRGKRLLNWQVKEWALGVAYGYSTPMEFVRDFSWMPDWVFDAITRQAVKVARAEILPGQEELRKIRAETAEALSVANGWLRSA